MLETLPEHIGERVRVVGEKTKIKKSGPVIVWLKSSHRFHENPAIDAGRILAHEHNLPLLVYHGIDERYPHSSLRHHNSLLDAAVDVARLCEKNGIRHTLHVAREGHRPSVMKKFGKLASIIITDLFPVPPWDEWVRKVSEISDCPVIEVDCHCVIPMPLYGKSVDRPFKFRSATKKLRKQRIQRHWPTVNVTPKKYMGELPFTPVEIESEVVDINSRFNLLKKCNIDPTVFPVWAEKGGEVYALSKWQKFLDSGLSGYARRRNNAADVTGVSRLSSAFHYGFLSPMKVARECAAVGTKSADKYLDELLIFREHAWHHIYSSDDPYSASNLPGWALGSWRRAESDVRTTLLPDYKLEYSQSPSDLWNDCQSSLTKHGELHNNLRMTWGKAIPVWTETLEKSLDIAQKLNDKYALDGRDPSSIVGVQWCHGLFDRPFEPSIPVMGTIRKRDIETHKSRLDFLKFREHINRKNGEENRIYIIKGDPIFQALAAHIIELNGGEVLIVKSNESGENTKISKLDLKILPDWISEMFDSILKDTENGNLEELITKLNLYRRNITLKGKQSFSHADLSSILQCDLSKVKLTIIESKGLEMVDWYEFTDDMLLKSNSCNSDGYDITEIFETISDRIWDFTEILWKQNSQNSHTNYSIQTTLM